MAGWIKTKTRLGAEIFPTFNPIDEQKLMTKLLHHQSQLYLEQDEITVASLAEFLNKVKTSVNNDDLLVLPQCLRG
ncbi:hypothetical protein IQE94_13685 [Synechocystis sp. PCC 7339]|nr:hypothetical protein [Synechocystis sp. PCC 7339]UAJ72136.1 hypothetical protein IQE94_13685 [Synechocystis sp. PCC 7339]